MKLHCVWLFRLGTFVCAGLCSGCFIEVGNPGEPSKVSARFQIDYGSGTLAKQSAVGALGAMGVTGSTDASSASGTAYVTSLPVGFLEMEYLTPDGSEHRLWGTETSPAIPLDFGEISGPDSLPTISISNQSFTQAVMELTTPAPSTPSSLHTGSLSGYWKTADSVPFTFPIPAFTQFNLLYGSTTISAWQHGDAYALEILFSVPRWLDSVDLSQAEATLDTSGRPILLLDSLHNLSIYLKLKNNFLKAFISDSTYVGGD